MALPKFIITMERLRVGEQGSGIGYLRLGMVNQHKDLLIGDDFHEVAREIDDRLNVDRPRAAGADLFCGGRAINVSDELQILYV